MDAADNRRLAYSAAKSGWMLADRVAGWEMDVKTTIWYEFTDKADVQALRDAADALERDGYVKLLLPNVELDDPPGAGGGGAGSAATNIPVGAAGYAGGADMTHFWLAKAKGLDKPVAIAGGGGAGTEAFSVWLFPDGHHERLSVGETPKWPKDNPLRDAVDANR